VINVYISSLNWLDCLRILQSLIVNCVIYIAKKLVINNLHDPWTIHMFKCCSLFKTLGIFIVYPYHFLLLIYGTRSIIVNLWKYILQIKHYYLTKYEHKISNMYQFRKYELPGRLHNWYIFFIFFYLCKQLVIIVKSTEIIVNYLKNEVKQ
jgi:hypothetical protein